MINSDVIIKLKGCSEKQRSEVKDILLSNYLQLLVAIEKEADYCSVDSYWKNNIPISKQIISADEFISKFGIKPIDTQKVIGNDKSLYDIHNPYVLPEF